LFPAVLPEGFRAEVVTISGMARQADTYTAAQAAQILGISERRVRQLVNEGKLSGNRAEDGTVRLTQQAVNDERKRRRGATATKAPASRTRKRAAAGKAEADGAPVDVDALATAVASAVGQRLEGQLEITRQAESLLRNELTEERAKRGEAEARLADAQRRIAELEAQLAAANDRRGGLFRRRA